MATIEIDQRLEPIAFPEERAQELFDSAVAISESTRQRVRLFANDDHATFVIGEKYLQGKRSKRMREGQVYHLR
ncbi:MAG: hypothetical protein A2869_02925 [Candidatus Levybacteria bacterium RIFCSPHIGHO2_01_FULL_40_58]|nr:MAG: hypothetical protein A2869_02925 [Candidatus Levybacteria bacterium RIFCSPHIGHO2_01_FULL_40_58]